MGPGSKVNQNYNLTWIFQADANFTYVFRFHFCEYQETRVNQRVFNIYLNNQTAQEGADVIGWAGSQGVPIYKDYAVYVGDRSGDEELWVALHPSVSMKPEYYDAILNGLEIFKLNDSRGSLAGPNPVPSLMMLQAEAKKGFSPSGSGRRGVIVEISTEVVLIGCHSTDIPTHRLADQQYLVKAIAVAIFQLLHKAYVAIFHCQRLNMLPRTSMNLKS
ncbi:hypothetical protein OIU76_013654 [Salix suchowensis]|nr:hypothetical protein OIU76_013654 [Salix suchowensis]